MKALRPHRRVADGCLGDQGVPVQVDALQRLYLVEASRVAGETVVSEADLPECSETNEGVGKKFYLVDSQAERVQLGQQAKFCREARQAVVAQVQYLQVP